MKSFLKKTKQISQKLITIELVFTLIYFNKITITTVVIHFFVFFSFFLKSFSPGWIRILMPDPDPGGKMNWDPDPQH